jgi:hypothetical protein
MDKEFLNHKIGAWKLAGMFDGLYYAFIDDMLDTDIKPSKYPAVVLRRIESAYAMRFITETPKPPMQLKNRYVE